MGRKSSVALVVLVVSHQKRGWQRRVALENRHHPRMCWIVYICIDVYKQMYATIVIVCKIYM